MTHQNPVSMTKTVPYYQAEIKPLKRRFKGIAKGALLSEILESLKNIDQDRHNVIHVWLHKHLKLNMACLSEKFTVEDWMSHLNLHLLPSVSRTPYDPLRLTPDIICKSFHPYETYDFIIIDVQCTRNIVSGSIGKEDKYRVLTKAFREKMIVKSFSVLESTSDVYEACLRLGLLVNQQDTLRVSSQVKIMSLKKEEIINSSSDPNHVRSMYESMRVGQVKQNFPNPGMKFSPSVSFLDEFSQKSYFSREDLLEDVTKGFRDESLTQLSNKDKLIMDYLVERIEDRLETKVPGGLKALRQGNEEEALSIFSQWVKMTKDTKENIVKLCHEKCHSYKDSRVDNDRLKHVAPSGVASVGKDNLLSYMDKIGTDLQGIRGKILSIAKLAVFEAQEGPAKQLFYGLIDDSCDIYEKKKELRSQCNVVRDKSTFRCLLEQEEYHTLGMKLKKKKLEFSLPKQFEQAWHYSLEKDTSIFVRFVLSMKTKIEEEHGNSLNPYSRPGMSDFDRNLESELCRSVNQMTRTHRRSKGYHSLLFYSQLYTHLALLAERPVDTKEFLVSSMAGRECVIFMSGGQDCSAPDCVRRWFMIYRPLFDMSEFVSPEKTLDSGWKVSSWNYFTPWHTEHYSRAADLSEAMCLEYLEEHLRKRWMPGTPVVISAEDEEYVDGLIPSLIMDEHHRTYGMIQNGRYLWMTTVSKTGDVKELLIEKQLKLPLRTVQQVYIMQRQISYYVNFKDNPSINWVKSKKRTIYSDSEEDPSCAGAKVKCPRMLWGGYHNSLSNLLMEMYFCQIETLRSSGGYHKIVAAFSKLVKMQKAYDDTVREDKRFVCGYGPNDLDDDKFLIDNLLSGDQKGIGYCRRLISAGMKLTGLQHLGESISSNLSMSDQNHLIDSRSKLTSSVKERVDSISKSVLMELKSAWQSKDGERNKLYHSVKAEVRSKVILNLIEEVGKLELLGQTVTNAELAARFISSLLRVYNDIADKLQIGAVRELMVQDIHSAFGSHFVESITKSVAHHEPREMLTKKNKLHVQVRLEREILKSKHIVVSDNADSENWGPRVITTEFCPVLNLFRKPVSDNLISGAVMQLAKMTRKVIEIPRKIWKTWLRPDFDPSRLDTYQRGLYDSFMSEGKLIFESEAGMGQGILHDTSSVKHCSMFYLEDFVENRIFRGNPLTRRKIAGSDDSLKLSSVPDSPLGWLQMAITQEIDESVRRVFNIKRSKSKSSFWGLLNEYNSNFCISGMTEPVASRFMIAAMKLNRVLDYEGSLRICMSGIRNAIFKGSSLMLGTLMIHRSNDFLDRVFSMEGRNNPSEVFGVERSLIPIQLGGRLELTASELFACGPDYHNYSLSHLPADKFEVTLPLLAWVLAEVDSVEQFDALAGPEEDMVQETLGSLKRSIKCYFRLQSKIRSIRRSLPKTREDVNSFLEKHPFCQFYPSRSNEESLMKMCAILYSKGTERTFSKVSVATDLCRGYRQSSGKYFAIMDLESQARDKEGNVLEIESQLRSYRDCLEEVWKSLPRVYDQSRMQSVCSGFMTRYDEYTKWSLGQSSSWRWDFHNYRSTVRSTEVRSAGVKLMNKTTDVLYMKWHNSEFIQRDIPIRWPLSVESDWRKLQMMYPFIKDSIKDSASCLGISQDASSQRRLVSSVIHTLMGSTTKKNDQFRCGKREYTVMDSFMMMSRCNSYQGKEMITRSENVLEYIRIRTERSSRVELNEEGVLSTYNVVKVLIAIASALSVVFFILPEKSRKSIICKWSLEQTCRLESLVYEQKTLTIKELLDLISFENISSMKCSFKVKRMLYMMKLYSGSSSYDEFIEYLSNSGTASVTYVNHFPLKESDGIKYYDRSACAVCILRYKTVSVRASRSIPGGRVSMNFKGSVNDRHNLETLTKLVKSVSIVFGCQKTSSLLETDSVDVPEEWWETAVVTGRSLLTKRGHNCLFTKVKVGDKYLPMTAFEVGEPEGCSAVYEDRSTYEFSLSSSSFALCARRFKMNYEQMVTEEDYLYVTTPTPRNSTQNRQRCLDKLSSLMPYPFFLTGDNLVEIDRWMCYDFSRDMIEGMNNSELSHFLYDLPEFSNRLRRMRKGEVVKLQSGLSEPDHDAQIITVAHAHPIFDSSAQYIVSLEKFKELDVNLSWFGLPVDFIWNLCMFQRSVVPADSLCVSVLKDIDVSEFNIKMLPLLKTDLKRHLEPLVKEKKQYQSRDKFVESQLLPLLFPNEIPSSVEAPLPLSSDPASRAEPSSLYTDSEDVRRDIIRDLIMIQEQDDEEFDREYEEVEEMMREIQGLDQELASSLSMAHGLASGPSMGPIRFKDCLSVLKRLCGGLSPEVSKYLFDSSVKLSERDWYQTVFYALNSNPINSIELIQFLCCFFTLMNIDYVSKPEKHDLEAIKVRSKGVVQIREIYTSSYESKLEDMMSESTCPLVMKFLGSKELENEDMDIWDLDEEEEDVNEYTT